MINPVARGLHCTSILDTDNQCELIQYQLTPGQPSVRVFSDAGWTPYSLAAQDARS